MKSINSKAKYIVVRNDTNKIYIDMNDIANIEIKNTISDKEYVARIVWKQPYSQDWFVYLSDVYYKIYQKFAKKVDNK